jgi:hypothetical protein
MNDVSDPDGLKAMNDIDAFLASRKQAGEQIDPDMADVWWQWADPSDPYCFTWTACPLSASPWVASISRARRIRISGSHSATCH